jgi:aryl-alcohol dehydrogenase-like predicted oxidoreductase
MVPAVHRCANCVDVSSPLLQLKITKMQDRALGPFNVTPIGLGCMNLSHAYGLPITEEQGKAVLLKALNLGITHFDTAALYGFGANEELVGKVLSPHRREFTLASKCGIFKEDGKRRINGRPEMIRATCEASLQRLKTDVIDLYYLHRWDKSVPIEDSVGELSRLVEQGKIRTVGLSEVSKATLLKAHAVHPISAVQTEYSLWTRNPELAVLQACRDIGATFVAFSPLMRGFSSGHISPNEAWAPGDIRAQMPRFSPENIQKNQAWFPQLQAFAEQAGCTTNQLALAWVLAQGDHVLAIPGTRSTDHLQENFQAQRLVLPSELLAEINDFFRPQRIAGGRYADLAQAEVDTEQY